MVANKILQILTGFLRFMGIAIIALAIIGFILLKINWRLFYYSKDLILPSAVVIPTPAATLAPTPIHIDSDVASIFNDKLNFVPADNVDFEDVHYVNKVVNKLITTWDGTSSQLAKLNLNDFSTRELDSFVDVVTDRAKNKVIPLDLQKYYLPQSSVLEIKAKMKSAHSEYIKYLIAEGVNKDYIHELETNTIVLDDTRIELITTDNPQGPESTVDYVKNAKSEVINADYSRLKISIYLNDIYRVSDKIAKSGIFGKLSGTNRTADLEKYRDARDLAVRYIMYKQMTLGLQKAVETFNTPEKYKKDKDSYLKATKTLSSLMPEYKLEWGGAVYNEINNRTLSQELQADYIAFNALSTVYRFSEQQNSLFKDYYWNRFAQSKATLMTAIKNYGNKFTAFPIENLKAKVLSDFISKIDSKNEYKSPLIQVNNDFGQLPKLLGDISTLNDEEIAQFWQALK